MVRRVGFPPEFLGVEPRVFFDPDSAIPDAWAPRGRWQGGGVAMHTFCDDYRQEFFWRRPMEGVLVASAAGVVTAPDFSIYADDPDEWASYQAWRSGMVAAFWQSFGVRVLPVVTFRGSPERFVLPGSVWAVRGPGRGSDKQHWEDCIAAFELRARPARLVVFGNQSNLARAVSCDVVGRALFSSKGPAAQKEVVDCGRA